MIPSAAIAQIRRLKRRTLIERCDIQRETDVETALGHERQWVDVAADIPCRLIRASRGMTGLVEGQEIQTEQYRLILPYDTVLTVNNRVIVDGVSYDVQDVRDNLTQNTDVQVTVVRIRT